MTTTALAERTTVQVSFTESQIALIKRTIARDATDDELKLFLAQCQRTGLDPFDRQIYFSKRRQWNSKLNDYEEVGRAETTIDGFRVVADRTGEMDGQDVEWCGADGQWLDVWLDDELPPVAARVRVYRRGCAHFFPAVAKYREYVQTTKDGKPNQMWRKMPANQIAKCAEALALRKAFPKQLSGIYTADEMAQADVVVEPPPVRTLDERATYAAAVVAARDDAERGVTSWHEVAPPGFHFVKNYKYTARNGMHEAVLLNYDAQGGSLKVATKQPRGSQLERAETFGVPIKVATSPKEPPVKGEAWLESIEFHDAAKHGPIK